MRRAMMLVAASALASAAAAEEVRLCGRQSVAPTADGRVLNHFPYPVTGGSDLVRSPMVAGQCQAVHRAVRADLEALLTSARADPSVGRSIYAISCFRGKAHQARIFCGPGRSVVTQAYQVAPPGFSEHATGFAIDFGDRRAGRCNLEICFERSAVARWLRNNAHRFGFEMSFPEGNAQGVSYEPWHWRWVGRDRNSEPARHAASLFAAAHAFARGPEPVPAVESQQLASVTEPAVLPADALRESQEPAVQIAASPDTPASRAVAEEPAPAPAEIAAAGSAAIEPSDPLPVLGAAPAPTEATFAPPQPATFQLAGLSTTTPPPPEASLPAPQESKSGETPLAALPKASE